jgi:hypothetical protein
MIVMRNFLIIFASFLLCSHQVLAGDGWPQKKAEGYFKLSQYWVIADSHYTNTGSIDPNATRGTYVTSLYGEYGITERLTGTIYFPFFVRALQYEQVSGTTGEVLLKGDAVNSMGDTQIGIKYGLLQSDQIAISGSFILGLPFGVNDGGRDGSLQTGTGEWNQMVRLDISKSIRIGQLYPFLSFYSAFNNRTNGFSDEFRIGGKLGVNIDRFAIQLTIDAVNSLNNGDPNFNSDGTGLYSNNAEFVGLTPEIAYRIGKNWGVTASYGIATSGQLIFADPAYSAGVYYTPSL